MHHRHLLLVYGAGEPAEVSGAYGVPGNHAEWEEMKNKEVLLGSETLPRYPDP